MISLHCDLYLTTFYIFTLFLSKTFSEVVILLIIHEGTLSVQSFFSLSHFWNLYTLVQLRIIRINLLEI